MKKIKISLTGIPIFVLLLLSFHCTAYNIIGLNPAVRTGLCAASFLMILLSLRNKNNRLTMGRSTVAMLLWLIILLIATINNGYLQHGTETMYFTFAFAILAAFILQYSDHWYGQFRKALMFFTLEHFVLAWLFWIFRGFYNTHIIPLFADTTYYRNIPRWSDNNVLMGLTSHYSTSGMYFAIATMTFFSLSLSYGKRSHKCLFLLMLFSLFMTQKRGPLLFAALACATTYFVYKKTNIKTVLKFTAGVAGIVLALILIMQAFPVTRGLINRIIQKAGSADVTGRMPMFLYAIELFKQHPLIGIGWAQFRYAFGSFSGEELSAHNVYLQLLAETGIIGTTFFLAVFAFCLYKCYHTLTRFRNSTSEIRFIVCYAFTSQVYFLLYSITGNPIQNLQDIVPYMLGLAGMCSVSLNHSDIRQNRSNLVQRC